MEIISTFSVYDDEFSERCKRAILTAFEDDDEYNDPTLEDKISLEFEFQVCNQGR